MKVRAILGHAVDEDCIKDVLCSINNNDQTVLHLACRYKYDNIRCLEEVIDVMKQVAKDDMPVVEKMIKQVDSDGQTFLSFIAEAREDVLQILIKTITDLELQQPRSQRTLIQSILTKKDNAHKTALHYAQEAKLANILTDFFTPFKEEQKKSQSSSSSGSINSTSSSSNKKQQAQNPHLIALDKDNLHDQDGLLRAIGKAKCLDMIKDDYVQKYLYTRWKKFGRKIFYTNLGLYFTMSLLLTVFVTSHAYDPVGVNGTSNVTCTFVEPPKIVACCAFLFLFSLATLVFEVLQMISNIAEHWRSLHNFADAIVCLSSLVLSIGFFATDYNCWQHQMGTAAFCLAWVNFAWMFTKIPIFDIKQKDETKNQRNFMFRRAWHDFRQSIRLMLLMLFRVIGRVCIFVPIFVFFIIIFALVFYNLMSGQKSFMHVGFSAVTVLAMTTGELNFVDVFFPDNDVNTPEFYVLSCIFFVIFIGIMTISTMNFLIGMALGDINDLREQSEVIAFNVMLDLTVENQGMYLMYQRCKHIYRDICTLIEVHLCR